MITRYSHAVMLVIFILFPASIGGCSTRPVQIEDFTNVDLSVDLFPVCKGYGCSIRTFVALNEEQWHEISLLFTPPAESPARERRALARAVGLFETYTGGLVGTTHDLGRSHPFALDADQMDCIDETVNTSVFLLLLEQKHLLAWHERATPARRGNFVDGRWPHNTAVIEEKGSGQKYALDSYYFNNGHDAVVIPLETWLAGWQPDKQENRVRGITPQSLRRGMIMP